jgi:predicted RNA-binding Zn-ribbon protein involved in translation (DUF1610 family)
LNQLHNSEGGWLSRGVAPQRATLFISEILAAAVEHGWTVDDPGVPYLAGVWEDDLVRMSAVDLDRLLEIVEEDEDIGVCTSCGNEQSAEPDAREYRCDSCGNLTVFGAAELLL